jgi:hypothetical protein
LTSRLLAVGNVTLTLGDREIVLRHRFELASIANEIGESDRHEPPSIGQTE